MWQTQHNFRIHILAAALAILLAAWLHVPPIEWMVLLLCIALVMAAEAFNSALEELADEVSTAWKPRIGHAKDMAAAAVLLTAIFAAVVGALIFVPRLLNAV